jgi:hypothetical protein
LGAPGHAFGVPHYLNVMVDEKLAPEITQAHD